VERLVGELSVERVLELLSERDSMLEAYRRGLEAARIIAGLEELSRGSREKLRRAVLAYIEALYARWPLLALNALVELMTAAATAGLNELGSALATESQLILMRVEKRRRKAMLLAPKRQEPKCPEKIAGVQI